MAERSLEGLGPAHLLERLIATLEGMTQTIQSNAAIDLTRQRIKSQIESLPGGPGGGLNNPLVPPLIEQFLQDAIHAQSSVLQMARRVEQARMGQLQPGVNPLTEQNAAAIAQLAIARQTRQAMQEQITSAAQRTQISQPADTARRIEEARASLQVTRTETAEKQAQRSFETGVGKPLTDENRTAALDKAISDARAQADRMEESRAFLQGQGKPRADELYEQQQRIAEEGRKSDADELQKRLDLLNKPAGEAQERQRFAEESRTMQLQRGIAEKEREIKTFSPEGKQLTEDKALEAADKRLRAARDDRDNLEKQLELLRTNAVARDAAVGESLARIDAMRAAEQIKAELRPFTDKEDAEAERIARDARSREMLKAPERAAQARIEEVRAQKQELRFGMSDEGKAMAQRLQNEQAELRKIQEVIRPSQQRQEIAEARANLAMRQDPTVRQHEQAEYLHQRQLHGVELQKEILERRNQLTAMSSPAGKEQRQQDAQDQKELINLQKEIARQQMDDKYGRAAATFMRGAEAVSRAGGDLGRLAGGAGRLAGGIASKDAGMAAAGGAEAMSAVKHMFDSIVAAASPQEAGRAAGAWEIFKAKLAESTGSLALRRAATNLGLRIMGEKTDLFSMQGLPKGGMMGAEESYQRLVDRSINMGAGSVENRLFQLQMQNLKALGGSLENIDRNTQNIFPAFR